jgi:dienelactone hydrolase
VTGPFATASVTVPRQNTFGGGVIYYPTDTSQGTFGAIAISPGLNGTWPGIAWLGPRLSSQGFVVFGIDTLAPHDSPASRGAQLLAALDHLTQTSPVRTRVDASRLAVAGHSLGGGGAFEAALRRPSLKAAIPNAPFFPGSASSVRVPTLITAMQNDSLVTQNRNAYNSIPASVEKAYVELAGAGHNQITQIWGGTLSTSGTAATVRNAAWNGTLTADATTTFGFIGTGSPGATPMTCASP